MPADILIYAIVAAGLVFWLRGVLGTRHGDERQRPNPFTGADTQPAAQALSGRPVDSAAATGGEGDPLETGLEKHMGISNAQAEKGLREIVRNDRGFRLSEFMGGAEAAFIMIVEAFSEGDRETLKNLLSPSVYDAFEGAIALREEQGRKAEVEVHAVRRAEVIGAVLDKKEARITVRFVSDETNVVRDKEGQIISGNPDRVSETIDIWTFGRNLRASSPVWLVCETRDEDAAEDEHKTVPDSEK